MRRKIFCAILAVVLAFLCAGCRSTPPTVEAVEERFNENYDDILTVVSFMINSGHEDIQIRDYSGTMYVDFEWIDITDASVNSAVERLLGSNLYRYIFKSGNTIQFIQWTGLQDIGCGITYTINGIDLPEIQHMTEIVPLSQDGWYYYVDDYNEWRLQQTP